MLRELIRDKKILTVPNALSLFRILLIPAIVLTYFRKEGHVAAFCLLVLSWITDVLDGWIARSFDMKSDLGIVLDPVADKLTQGCVILVLAGSTPWMAALCALLIVKESVMAVYGMIVLKKTNRTYSARWHGKVATGCIYTTLAVHILWKDIPKAYSNSMIALSAAAMILSLILYCRQYVSILQKTSEQTSYEKLQASD
ncbi:MAG: CDP-alcohol phosphatidyltransferase family protein [Christensenella sp.]|nr:CDP-alcohol phosphatidyltransferase family protein [Christensenella sp.]